MANADLTTNIYWDDKKKIEHIDGLWWVKGDTGSWEGPESDWTMSHYSRIVKPCVDAGRVGVAVQAGGNLGLYPKLLSKYFKRIYTFEPELVNFACLCKNVVEDNVFKINAAVGSYNHLTTFEHVDYANRGASRLGELPDAGIPTFTIDNLALTSLDLLWLDIEGYEEKAIEGAKRTITDLKPLIVALESTNDKIQKFLDEAGYDYTGSSVADKVYQLINS